MTHYHIKSSLTHIQNSRTLVLYEEIKAFLFRLLFIRRLIKVAEIGDLSIETYYIHISYLEIYNLRRNKDDEYNKLVRIITNIIPVPGVYLG